MNAGGRWSWRIDGAVFVGLFVLVVGLVWATERDVGFTRDEGYYFKAAQDYWGWFEALGRDPASAFTKKVIDDNWEYNHEHPGLVKGLFAVSWGLLKEKLGLFQLHSTAMRFPAFGFSGLCIALLYALARAVRLRRETSLLAALMFLCMPRVFWHMHLACFDIAVCAAHLWLVLAYLKGRQSARGALVIGLAFGLAAAVKHNVLVAPAFFVLHWLLTEARGFAFSRRGWRLPPIPWSFVSMAVVGPLVFIALWPYLWPDIGPRIGWYINFHLSHEHYPILWFKELLTAPPFPVSFPFVMSAITVPVVALVVLLFGTVLGGLVLGRAVVWPKLFPAAPVELTRVRLLSGAREGSASVVLLLLLNAAFPFLLIALPSSPIFGGTKHWLNALPFLCVLGAWAIEEAAVRLSLPARGLQRHRAMPVGATLAVAAVLVLGPGAWLTARAHPYGLSSYNSVIGFTRGAANAGFQRTFWGYEVREALPFINENLARAPSRLMMGDTNRDDWRMYKRDGLIRSDIVQSSHPRTAQGASVQPQGEFKNEFIKVLNEMGRTGPQKVIHLEGVPLLTVTLREDGAP